MEYLIYFLYFRYTVNFWVFKSHNLINTLVLLQFPDHLLVNHITSDIRYLSVFSKFLSLSPLFA